MPSASALVGSVFISIGEVERDEESAACIDRFAAAFGPFLAGRATFLNPYYEQGPTVYEALSE